MMATITQSQEDWGPVPWVSPRVTAGCCFSQASQAFAIVWNIKKNSMDILILFMMLDLQVKEYYLILSIIAFTSSAVTSFALFPQLVLSWFIMAATSSGLKLAVVPTGGITPYSGTLAL